jgi:hypothetical protein
VGRDERRCAWPCLEAQQRTITELAAKIKALEAAQDNPRATTDRQ